MNDKKETKQKKEQYDSIYTKLVKAQCKVSVPKTKRNDFGGYMYRDLDGIMQGVKPINDELGLTLFLTDEPFMIGDRFYIKATATLVNNDNPEETITVSAFARESLVNRKMDESQTTGSSSSYARKYALNGLYLLDDVKDNDTDEYRQENYKREQDYYQQVQYQQAQYQQPQYQQPQQAPPQAQYQQPQQAPPQGGMSQGEFLKQVKQLQKEILEIDPSGTVEQINAWVLDRVKINDITQATGRERSLVINNLQGMKKTVKEKKAKEQQEQLNWVEGVNNG